MTDPSPPPTMRVTFALSSASSLMVPLQWSDWTPPLQHGASFAVRREERGGAGGRYREIKGDIGRYREIDTGTREICEKEGEKWLSQCEHV